MQLNKDKEVREKCYELYTRDFSPRTWYAWRQIAEVPKHERWLTEEQVANLFAIALLKKEQPLRRLTLLDIYIERKTRDWNEWLVTMAGLPPETLIAPCKGHELTETIRNLTGRKIAEPTLYEWGREVGMVRYSRMHEYTASQVAKWVNRANHAINKQEKNHVNPRINGASGKQRRQPASV